MGEDRTSRSAEGPGGVYAEQLGELQRLQALDQRLERRLGLAKLAIAFVAIASAIVLLYYIWFFWLLLFPAIAFVWLAVLHENRLRQMRQRSRAIEFHTRGMARVEDRWMGTGETGERFLDPAHPYARDLDIFGPSSLFELLCTARTRAGEAKLADWLLVPAGLDEVVARHGAIDDLRARLKLREQLFCLGETVRAGIRPDLLPAWGERNPILSKKRIKITTTLLGIAWIAAMVAWAVWGMTAAALAISALNLAWAHRIHARWDESADAIEESTGELDVLAGILRLIDHGEFVAPKLQEIQARLKHEKFVPSDAIAKLDRIVGYLESRRNPAMRLLDTLTFWSAQCVFLAEKWQAEYGPHIRSWLENVGEFEALTALAGYAFEHPNDVFPEFVQIGPLFQAKGITHPILPADVAVRNDVELGGQLQLIVLSGPNMAGKSTFIRSRRRSVSWTRYRVELRGSMRRYAG
jgi:hypothetical protein